MISFHVILNKRLIGIDDSSIQKIQVLPIICNIKQAVSKMAGSHHIEIEAIQMAISYLISVSICAIYKM